MTFPLIFGQSLPKKHVPLSRQAAPIARATSKYLRVPFDPSEMNLGPDFRGHNIEEMFNAIKSSPNLKPKSEFESTAEFDTRERAFSDQAFYGTLTPRDELAFVLEGESLISSPFKYDADSQIMQVSLSSNSTRFLLEAGEPTLDTIVARSVVRSHDTYVGSNAFGATAEVQDVYGEDYGLAFNSDNWLFTPSTYGQSAFTYLLPMPPTGARSIEADGRILIIGRLSEPWILHNVHGHDPTVDDPYKSVIGENYLRIVPEQLWIFDQKTGDVVARISKLSLNDEQAKQLLLQNQQQQMQMQAMLRETPLILEVPAELQGVIYRVTIDDQSEDTGILSSDSIFRAKRKIRLVLDHPHVASGDLVHVSFKLDGKSYLPNWQKDSTRIGDSEFINSLTAVIELDQQNIQ